MGMVMVKKGTFVVRSLILTVVFLSVMGFGYLLPTVTAAAEIEIVSHSSYIETYGYYRIVGEVQNVGDEMVRNVEIAQTYYDTEGAVIGTSAENSSGVEVSLTNLYPGRKSPFAYTFYGNASLVDHYSLAVVDFTPYEYTTDRQKLNITSHSSSIVEGEMIITGEVEHIEGSSASLVKVLATCYDEFGTVVVMGGQSGIAIDAGQPAAFEITLDDNVPFIASYELTTEAPFYDMIPEFNPALLSLIVIPLISIAFLLSKRNMIPT
jgi:hypothetical protein